MLTSRFTNVPHVPRSGAFLDSRDMIGNPVEVFERYRKRLGPTFSFHFGGVRRTIVSTEPNFIEQVLLRNRHKYEKSDIQVQRMVEFQGRGLVNIHGREWLRQRRLIALGFKPDRLSERLPIQRELLDELMIGFDAEATRGPVDVHSQMVRITLGLVGKSIFGRAMSDEELRLIGDTISEIQGFIVRQIVQPYLIPWYRISGQSEKYQALRLAADKLVLAHIRQRRAAGTGELDFLDLLLDTPYPDTGEAMSENQALIEALQLMVAGNETSSNALTWILYLLGQHPSYITDIRQEIGAVIGDGPVDFDPLHRLEQTTKVIYEALRLYPPFWMIDRIAIEDDEILGVRIPKGTLVIPYIYGTHRNEDQWDEPETFDPSRFDRDACEARSSFAYIPFGGGPRTCVGNNMALMQMLLVVVELVRRYDFAAVEPGRVGIRPMMLLRPDTAVRMRFERR